MNRRMIEVVEYDPAWVTRFERERVALADAIGANALAIRHIGSTSVPGLCAKPVIDMLLEVRSLSELDLCQDKLEALGYLAKGENGIPGRRYFQKGGTFQKDGTKRSHHLHAFESGDNHLRRHLAFKAYLLAHPDLASEYGKIKQDAAARCHHDISVYLALKHDFLQEHEALALAWYAQGRR